jgi:hypothetical protein
VSVRRLALVLLAAVSLSACVVEMVDKRKPRMGPVPEVGFVDVGGGEVRYSVEGWDWVVDARRSTALRRMRRVCKGQQLRVVQEFTRDDVDTPYSKDDMSELAKGVEHFDVKPYRHIVFQCEPQGKPYLKP